LWLGVAAIVLPLLSLAPYLASGTEAARARNSLVLDESADASGDWTPPQVPPGFLVERASADPMFVEVAQRLHLADLPSDWERAVAISAHLLESSPTLRGGAIQGDLQTTYRRIVGDGDGYCVDFVQSFNAIALAAGMTTRSWAFSFDGFGGHGHIFPEVWNRQTSEWQLVDVFNNAYFTIADKPLSARAFRAAMLAGRDIRMHRLAPSARPGYVLEKKAWDYYRRGLPEWYLWWGTNPFSYEQASSVRLLSPLSRALAQLGAMAQGVHPHIHVLATVENRSKIEALRRVRLHLSAVLLSVCIGLVACAWALARRRPTRDAPLGEGVVRA
jgi:hypothetical protein